MRHSLGEMRISRGSDPFQMLSWRIVEDAISFAKLGMGWCGKRLTRKHCSGVVVDGYHPCSGLDDGDKVVLDNKSLCAV